MQVTEPEDILSTSLEAFYGFQPITLGSAGTTFVYSPKDDPTAMSISLRVPDTQKENWSLYASDIWISSVHLADHIQELHLEDRIQASPSVEPFRVLELGAGAGLPGILIAKKYSGCAVTISDYPDDHLINNLTYNVECNDVASNCRVVAYEWGSGDSALIDGSDGFDVVVAADTLWNSELHHKFIEALRATLSKRFASRIYLVAGLHTGRYTIQAFLDALALNGLEIDAILERCCSGNEERAWCVFREGEDDMERRRWVVWVTVKWPLALLEASLRP